ncbi:MAG: oleate hydratase [Telmatospirillum sp.]|nr:oleate hydratase [Telmatospirillum sp.]
MSTSNANAASSASHGKFYLVGGGIASLAAAAFLVRDGDVPGSNIVVFESLPRLGGSLDGSGTPEAGYVARGGRMLEAKYLCTFGLFDTIPTLDGKQSVTQEIVDWNKTMRTSSKARLMRAGIREDAPDFGLAERHIAALSLLVLEPEALVGRVRISERFDAAFFRTNFWLMWCTTFAFQPWHGAAEFRRYLLRFAHMVPGFSRLQGILRTPLNQYDSMVRPLEKWLSARGVVFVLGARVADIAFADVGGVTVPRSLTIVRAGKQTETQVEADDRVVVTLGSMTDDAILGTTDLAPVQAGGEGGGAWPLWRKIAAGRANFGRPEIFDANVAESAWVSFTATMRNPDLLDRIRTLTGNVPGEGGLVTFPDSNWLASIVVPHQPHFAGQPADVTVLWGYGLAIHRPGNAVAKPMAECTGAEILTEIAFHLGIETAVMRDTQTRCIPCAMPYITSQFLPRGADDRPSVIPPRTARLAFVGQFCEVPDDVVFTVEYSIRSAQVAAYALLGLDRAPPAVYRGMFDPRVLFKAAKALHDIGAA